MNKDLMFELIKISPFILFIFFIGWALYSLIINGKIKGEITIGDRDTKK